MGFKIKQYVCGDIKKYDENSAKGFNFDSRILGDDATLIYGHDTDDPREAAEAAVRKGISLDGADLSGVILDGAILDGASFIGARLDGASFDGAGLNGARFDDARLNGAKFTGAELNEATFNGALLNGACFDEASLISTSFIWSSLKGASFNKAILRGSLFDDKIIGAASFDDAVIDRLQLNGEEINTPPGILAGLRLPVLITPTKMKIGWLLKSHKEWIKFNRASIAYIEDSCEYEEILAFWKKWKHPLLAMCSAHADAEREDSPDTVGTL